MRAGPGIIVFWIVVLGLIGWGVGHLAGGPWIGMGVGAVLGLLLGVRRRRVRASEK